MALALGVGLIHTSNAQTYNFSIPTGSGGTNVAGTSASGSVTFAGSTVNLFISNTSSISSTITEVFLLNPIAPDATSLIAPDPGTTNWSLSNDAGSFNNILNNYSSSSTDYFGAVLSPINTGGVLPGNPSTLFSFTLGGTPDMTSYLGTGVPYLLIRYQTVGEFGEDSAKAYGWFEEDDFPTTPVPEPRLIAPLAVLGLGGLLYVRRRIKGKGKKTA